MEMSLVGTSLFVLSRRLDLNFGNPKSSQGLDGVCSTFDVIPRKGFMTFSLG